MLAEFVALLVPPRCAACRGPSPRAAEPLCPACRRALPWLAQPLCERCALPRHGRRPCPARDAAFDAAWAAVAYDGAARDALHALKFAGARPLAAVMAAQIAAAAPPALLAAGALLVPVPAHPARRRARGYDQADLLARALARRTGLPVRRALARRGRARQLGAPASVRRAPGRLRISARGPAPAAAILVDDVHTTGATLQACAAALKGAGTLRVVAVTWARTLDDRPVDTSVTTRTIDGRTSFSTERTPT